MVHDVHSMYAWNANEKETKRDPQRKWDDMKAYKAIVCAKEGQFLLGGVKRHESTPFATRDMAEHWLWVVTHKQMEKVDRAEIKEVNCSNPIS